MAFLPSRLAMLSLLAIVLTPAAAWAQAGTITFDVAESEIQEDGGTAQIRVRRVGGSSGDVSARIRIVPVTATGADYVNPGLGSVDPERFKGFLDDGPANTCVLQADGGCSSVERLCHSN